MASLNVGKADPEYGQLHALDDASKALHHEVPVPEDEFDHEQYSVETPGVKSVRWAVDQLEDSEATARTRALLANAPWIRKQARRDFFAKTDHLLGAIGADALQKAVPWGRFKAGGSCTKLSCCGAQPKEAPFTGPPLGATPRLTV